MIYRAIVIDADAANRMLLGAFCDDWFEKFPIPDHVTGVQRIERDNILYFVGARNIVDTQLLVISGRGHDFFPEIPLEHRIECFIRILRVGLSRFQPAIKIPIDWRSFHSESLLSFQTNRWSTQIRARVYMDFAPEGTDHVYAYAISTDDGAPLIREGYDSDLFTLAVLSYDNIASHHEVTETLTSSGQLSVALTKNFSDSDIAQGVPFSVWRDSKLTRDQRQFFDAPFEGPLRVRGAAGTGKTLVLCLRFLKEIYQRLDNNEFVRAAFLVHGQETADHIRTYLLMIDERNLLLDTPSTLDLTITTLHGVANDFINYDVERIQPLSLDGTDGRVMQMEIVNSLVGEINKTRLVAETSSEFRESFRVGLTAAPNTDDAKAFCLDLIDEFTNVLETFGTRDVDQIVERYLSSSPSPRALARRAVEKHIILELYRKFRNELSEMGVISLDQFIADFLAYLNSFRWEAVRNRRGFDFVFADELHLFNRQERPVLGYLLRNHKPPRVAVAYDPRQSPRNTFFPTAKTDKDTIWSEAGLSEGAKQFELTQIFRYTPQIVSFLHQLNLHFPANDLAEEWGLTFGTSQVPEGPKPKAFLHIGQESIGANIAKRAQELARRATRGNRIAVLCLDADRFRVYREAGIFKKHFIAVSARDEIGSIQKYTNRVILSMPEYVAGLQFDTVLLIDANATLIGQLGGGVNGLQRFISAAYLGASRAKINLEIYADSNAGGFAQPIRDAIDSGALIFN